MDKTRAYQQALRAFGPGTEAAAAAMRMSVSTLQHKVSPTYPTMFFSPEEGIEFQELTGNHGPLEVEAAALGYSLKRMEASDEAASPAHALNVAVREFGDLLSCVTRAMEDGRVTERELAEVDRECAELMAGVHELRARVAALHEAGKPPHLRREKKARRGGA